VATTNRERFRKRWYYLKIILKDTFHTEREKLEVMKVAVLLNFVS